MVGNSNVLGILILAVQWLGPGACTAKGLGSVPRQGTKILQVAWHGQKKKSLPKSQMVKRDFAPPRSV